MPSFTDSKSGGQKKVSMPDGKQTPSIADLVDYFIGNGLVGELSPAVTGVLCCYGGGPHLSVLGSSSGGKTKIMESIVGLSVPRNIPDKEIFNNAELLLKEGNIFRLELSSETAGFYLEDQINQSELIVIPELQKIADQKLVNELLKTAGEGRDAIRHVTKPGGYVETQVVESKKLLTSLATENIFSLDEEVELSNRFLKTYIDNSAEQTKEIMLAKARKRAGLRDGPELTEDFILWLKQHVKQTWKNDDVEVINPFAESIVKNDYLPSQFVLSRRFVDYYLDLIDASTRWNSNGRVYFDGKPVTNIEDVYIIERFCGNFIRSEMLRLPADSHYVFKVFQDVQTATTKQDKELYDAYLEESVQRVMLPISVLQQRLGESGIVLGLDVVEDICVSLSKNGYCQQHPKDRHRFGLVNVGNPEASAINFRTILSDAKGLMKQNYGDVVDPWLVQNSGLVVMDPVTRETVDLSKFKPAKPGEEVTQLAREKTGLDRFL